MDPCIKELESDLLLGSVILNKFEDIIKGTKVKEWSKIFNWISINFMILLCMLRSMLVLLLLKLKIDPQFLAADYLQAIGVSRSIIHIWWITYSMAMLVFRCVIRYYESSGRLNFITDLYYLKKEPSESRLKLTGKNIQKLRFLARFLNLLVRVFTIGIFSSVMILHIFAFYRTCKQSNGQFCTSSHLIWYIFWLFQAVLWLAYVVWDFTLIFSTYSLAAVHILMRFLQLNERSEEPLWAPTVQRSRQLIWKFIQEHEEITKLVNVYNRPIRWILFCVQYIFQFNAALGLYVILSSEIKNPVIKITMVLVATQQITILMAFAVSAGFIYSQARKSYATICVIRNVNSRFYGYKLNFRLDKLIGTIASANRPISFYCYNLFPYTNVSTIQVSKKIIQDPE